MQKRTCESGQPRALKAHRNPRCRERSFGSLKSVKLFFVFFENATKKKSAWKALKMQAGRLRSRWPTRRLGRSLTVHASRRKMPASRRRSQLALPLVFVSSSSSSGHSPQSFPVALELRRVGVGHRPRITVGADAAELQGPWSAPDRGRGCLPSSVFPLPLPLPNDESDQANEAAQCSF